MKKRPYIPQLLIFCSTAGVRGQSCNHSEGLSVSSSNNRGYLLHIHPGTGPPTAFSYIFHGKLGKKWNHKCCAWAGGSQPREVQVLVLGHSAQACRRSGKERLGIAVLPGRIMPLYPSSASQQSFLRECSFWLWMGLSNSHCLLYAVYVLEHLSQKKIQFFTVSFCFVSYLGANTSFLLVLQKDWHYNSTKIIYIQNITIRFRPRSFSDSFLFIFI